MSWSQPTRAGEAGWILTALSHSPSVGTFWQIQPTAYSTDIDFANLSRRTPDAFDK
jgi:hypothetical protein